MKKRSVLVTWALSYAALLALLVALYFAQSASAKVKLTQEYQDIASTLQKQTETIIDAQLKQLKLDAITLCSDDSIYAYALKSSPKGANYYTLGPIQKKIASQCVNSPYVSEICLYFANINKVLTSQTIYTLDKFVENEIVGRVSRDQFADALQRSLFNEFIRVDDGIWLMTSFSPVSEGSRATLIQMLDLSQLQEIMAERVAIDDSTLLLIDEEGNLLCNAGEVSRANDILAAWLEGETQLVVDGNEYWKVENTLDEVGWTLLTVQPLSAISSRADWIWDQTLPTLLIVFAVGLVLTLALLYTNYRPLKELQNRVGISKGNEYTQIDQKLTSLESELSVMQYLQQEQLERATEEFFTSCLRNPSILFDEGVWNMLSRIGFTRWDDYFAVCLFSEESESEIQLFIQKIGTQHEVSVSKAAYDDVVMLLISAPAEHDVQNTLDIMQTEFADFPYSNSSIHHGARKEMYAAIHEARNAMAPSSSDTFAFSPAQEELLSRYILAGNADAAKALLNDVYNENNNEKKLSYAMRRCLTFDVLAALVKVAASVPHEMRSRADSCLEKTMARLNSNWNDAAHYELLCELADELSGMCTQTVNVKGKTVSHKETHTLSLEDIFKCVDQHFMQSDFNVSRAAELLDVSVAYLSRCFKEMSGINLLAYISGVRISYAKELMSKEKISVMEAACRAGFENPNTFIRAFKKYEGITPGNYLKTQSSQE